MLSSTLLNSDEADSYRLAIKDPITRELIGIAFGTLVKSWMKGLRPTGGFDALFFAKILEKTFEDHHVIEGILRGESIMWPDSNSQSQ